MKELLSSTQPSTEPSTQPSMQAAVIQCPHCVSAIEPEAKFCGSCGFLVPPYPPAEILSLKTQSQPPLATSLPNKPEHNQSFNIQQSLPYFVQLHPTESLITSNKELSAELGKLMVLLARERLFLYMHWLIFLGVNLLGCCIAVKCYTDYIGDELTKIMIASTPFLYINSLALMCIVPILGTRRQIARLKERLSYVKFRIEYGHLLS